MVRIASQEHEELRRMGMDPISFAYSFCGISLLIWLLFVEQSY